MTLWWRLHAETNRAENRKHRVSTDREAQDAEFDQTGWRASIVYIVQKDCTAGLDAGDKWEIPFTKVNQVNSSYTSQTEQGRAALQYLYLLYDRKGKTPWHHNPKQLGTVYNTYYTLYYPSMALEWRQQAQREIDHPVNTIVSRSLKLYMDNRVGWFLYSQIFCGMCFGFLRLV